MVDVSVPQNICLACGLCCDGTIFTDVKLQAGDDGLRLQAEGLVGETREQQEVTSWKGKKFPQPCAAFEGCRCRVYNHRPSHCRNFECLLLQKVKGAEVTAAAAAEKIRRARKQAARVRRLLGELGDADENVSLNRRFRRTSKRLEKKSLDEETAGRYGELTVAVHELNLLLSQEFYPGHP